MVLCDGRRGELDLPSFFPSFCLRSLRRAPVRSRYRDASISAGSRGSILEGSVAAGFPSTCFKTRLRNVGRSSDFSFVFSFLFFEVISPSRDLHLPSNHHSSPRFKMVSSPTLLLLLAPLVVLASPAPTAAPSVVTVRKPFPLSAFKSYYDGFSPTQTSAQVQPVVSDPVNGRIYELDLSSSQTIPGNDTFGRESSCSASLPLSSFSLIIGSRLTVYPISCPSFPRVSRQLAQPIGQERESHRFLGHHQDFRSHRLDQQLNYPL